MLGECPRAWGTGRPGETSAVTSLTKDTTRNRRRKEYILWQGQQGIFSLVKGTLSPGGNCNFLLGYFKGTKAMARRHGDNRLCCLCEVSGLEWNKIASTLIMNGWIVIIINTGLRVHYSVRYIRSGGSLWTHPPILFFCTSINDTS